MQKFLETHYKKIIIVGFVFMFSVSALNAWNDSAIFDETAHIGAAYSYVTQKEMRLNPEHPPLIKDLAGLPLLFLDLKFDVNQPFWNGTLPGKWDEGQWASGRYLLYQAGNNPDLILFWSRFPIIIISLFLGLLLFKWGRELGGVLAGTFAFVFYAFDPNILGHNHFVTTDIGIAAAFAFAFYFYFKFIKNPVWKNILLAGLFLGILQITKFSFFIAYPVIGLATLIYPLVIAIPDNISKKSAYRAKKLGEYVGKGAIIFAISMAIVWIAYFINTFNMSPETINRVIDANFSPVPDSNDATLIVNECLHKLNNHSITRPLVEWGIGIGYVFRRVAGGNGAYFLGQVSSQAFPLYFPVVFLIKETLPFLALIAFTLFFTLFSAGKSIFTKKPLRQHFNNLTISLRTHITEWSLLLFIALYALISVTGNLNIGLRHLFPIFPFLYLFVARAMAKFIKTINFQSRKIALPVFSILLGWIMFESAAAHPFHMSYFNQTAGGPKNGYGYVTDSNADWGQDLKRLKKFLAAHPEIDKIRVDYFGGGDIKTYIGGKYLQWWDSKRPVEPGWYAISVNFLMGSLYDTAKKDDDSYRWLREIKKQPAYQVGTSILIFNITPEDIQKIQ